MLRASLVPSLCGMQAVVRPLMAVTLFATILSPMVLWTFMYKWVGGGVARGPTGPTCGVVTLR